MSVSDGVCERKRNENHHRLPPKPKTTQEIRERLATEEGATKYRKRQTEAEPVFGQIKHNQQFQRFSLRGLPKITLEWGLVCAAHNLKKWAAATDPTRKKQ
ncbi:transposase [Aeribacillus pallidus]|uniref:transposase n=1 Tax=Aeribacillus pallidus TaxID=33936 RepID=UPI003D3223C3